MNVLLDRIQKHWWVVAIFLALVLSDIIFTHIGITYLGMTEGNSLSIYLMNISMWAWGVTYFMGACLIALFLLALKKFYLIHALSALCLWVICLNIETLIGASA
jgi:hypothetical protein